MKVNNGFLLTFLYIISVALYYLDKSETLKYFQYALPFIGLFLNLTHLPKTWKLSNDLGRLEQIILLLILLNFIIILINGEIYNKFIQESFLFIGALIFSVTLAGNNSQKTSSIFPYILYSLIVIFVIDRGNSLISVILNPSELYLGLLTSNIQTESSLCFYFSILGLYFIFEKDKTKAALSILFMILSFKRVAIIGFALVSLIYFILNASNIRYNRKAFSLFLTSFNFFYLWILIGLIDGSFDQFISDTFGVSSNFLFMGRIDLYNNVLSETGQFNLLGVGIGKISTILNKFATTGVGEGVLLNLHSDILKYYLEFGAILFPFFLYNFIYFLSRSKEAFCLTILLNIIFLTDNVSIYFCFMTLFYIVNFKLSSYYINNRLPERILNIKIPVSSNNISTSSNEKHTLFLKDA